MEYQEFTAKTLDEAITQATVALGITSDHLEYTVVERGSSGFLGLGRKDVTISAKKKEEGTEEKAALDEVQEPEQEAPAAEQEAAAETDAADTAEEKKEHKPHIEKKITEEKGEELKGIAEAFLKDVFSAMDMEVETKTEISTEDNSLSIDMEGSHMGIVIGKRGQTLDALQYLVNLAVNKHSDTYIRVKLDTEDYRNRRKETLENLARNIAFKVKKTRRPVSLEAMNPYERRTIHFALQNDEYVTTYSEGDEPFRHVVVTLKK